MDELGLTGGDARLPGEVVEQYSPPGPREVVETYVRPLPKRLAPKSTPPVKKHEKRGLWIFLGVLAVVIALSAVAWDLRQTKEPAQGEESPDVVEEITIPTYPTGQGAVLPVMHRHGESMTAQEIYRQVNPSVVTVLAQLDKGVSVGTGVVFTTDGYILTNYHVLEGGRDCTVVMDTGRNFEATYVSGDAVNDLAVLKVEQTALPAAAFGDSDALTVGDPVYAIGNPLGVELRGTLTDGIVSAINRDVWVDGRTMSLIQTNAALNSGNSGGPLINAYGQVVGINTIKMSSAYSSVEGLGFAIPSSSIDRMVNDLLTLGRIRPEPVLGVSVSQTGTRLEDELLGLEVLSVTPGGAAALAGVEEGDFILTAGGVSIATSQDLLRVRRQYNLGDTLPMTLWSHGEMREVSLLLKEAVHNDVSPEESDQP